MKWTLLGLLPVLLGFWWAPAAAQPSAYQVYEQALRVAQLRTEDMISWRQRARWRAALPQLRFTFQRDFDEGLRVVNHDNISISSGNITVGPDEKDITRDFGAGNRFQVAAVWELDKLIFNRDAALLSQERRKRHQEKQVLLEKVNQYFFERAAALQELKQNRRLSRKQRRQLYWRAQERQGRLDALTAGWFSRTVNQEN